MANREVQLREQPSAANRFQRPSEEHRVQVLDQERTCKFSDSHFSATYYISLLIYPACIFTSKSLDSSKSFDSL